MEYLAFLAIISSITLCFFVVSSTKSKLSELKGLLAEKENIISTLADKFQLLQRQTINPNEIVPKSVYIGRESELKNHIILLQNSLEQSKIEIAEMKTKCETLASKQKSEQVRMGLLAEQIVPFLADFQHNPKDLRPMFNPIDYVCFEEDKITFVEVKTGNAVLSQKQKNIQKLVEEGKVFFEVYRMKSNAE